jgi:hypothetical protein
MGERGREAAALYVRKSFILKFPRDPLIWTSAGKGDEPFGDPGHQQPETEPEHHRKCTDSNEGILGKDRVSCRISGGENADEDASRKERNYDRQNTTRYRYGAPIRDPGQTFWTASRAPGDVGAAIGAAHQTNQLNQAARREVANNALESAFSIGPKQAK